MDIKIQRFYGSIIVLIVCVGFIPLFSRAQTSSDEERIKNFDVIYGIQKDAKVNVTELIVYDFGQNQRHGIFRDIPIYYKTSVGNQSAKISNIFVTDETEKAYTFSSYTKGNDLEIKIGDPNITLSGVKTYDISYTISNAIGYFKDFDELYWNATGNGWVVPIDEVSATLTIPTSISEQEIKSSCYQGSFGSTATCQTTLTTDSEQKVTGAHFSTTNLGPGEGLTFALGFPKGIVTQPTEQEKFIQFLKDNAIVVLPIIVFIIMFSLWWQKGKDPKGRGTIVPEYEAPDNLSPLEMSALLHQGVKTKDISAEIIYLATLGYLKITKLEEKTFIFNATDYELARLKPSKDLTNEFDRLLLDGLFGSVITFKDEKAAVATLGVLARFIPTTAYVGETDAKNLDIVNLSALKNAFYTKLPGIKKSAIASIISRGYYPTDPNKIINKYVIIGVLFIFVLWGSAATGLITFVAAVSFVFSAAIVILFGIFMPKVTEQGAIARERIEGLKMYMKVAEEERIKFHNAPAKNPELFEKLLPYAMVLGLEKEWAQQFEGILTTPPNWYSDTHGGAFNAVIFSNNLSSFSSAASSSLSTAPGGHSGSGGGGSSGGGGGGGGGGSW